MIIYVCFPLSVPSGFDGIQEQNICNNIMAKLIQNYSTIFKSAAERSQTQDESSNIIVVKVSVDITLYPV